MIFRNLVTNLRDTLYMSTLLHFREIDFPDCKIQGPSDCPNFSSNIRKWKIQFVRWFQELNYENNDNKSLTYEIFHDRQRHLS